MSYNNIFERFIANESDETPLIQIYIAYAQYKDEKKDWIIQQSQKLGRRPTADETAVYVETWSDLRIRNTIKQSRDVVDTFRDSVMEQYGVQLENVAYENSFRRFEDQIKSVENSLIKETKRGIWKEAWIGALGNFLWMICTILIVVAAAFIVDTDRVIRAFKVLAGL